MYRYVSRTPLTLFVVQTTEITGASIKLEGKMGILRFLGSGVFALVRFIVMIIADLVREIAHGLSNGLSALFRATAPYLIGGGSLYILWIYRPEIAIGIVQTVVLCVLIFFGARMIFRGAFSSPKKSTKKG